MRIKPPFITCALALLIAAQSAFAVSSYRSRVPNGTVHSCDTCHDLANGAPDLNRFGDAFLSAGNTWNAALANLDSDGDGAKNGVELGDATGSGTPTPGAQVTNPGDPASKPSATAPSITTQPASQTVTAGANVTFTVGASGTAPLSYQWRKNGSNIAGATGTSLALNSVTSANAGSYTVLVSNSAGSVTSGTATLTVNPAAVAPSITTQPASQTVTAGANVTFTVGASGTAPLGYQWRKNGGDIAGATTSSLVRSSVTSADAGSYTVQVSNSAGSATSATATLTVNALVTVPSITTQPASQTVSAGANVTFTVGASGSAPLSYQWRKNGSDIVGATTSSLARSSVTSADAGSYAVQVSNTAGSVTSASATLTVNALVTVPSITTQPASQTVTAGANVTFTVGASGSAPLSYQWRKNGSDLVGATTSSLVRSSVTSADAGSYTVQVSNAAGSVTSATATLTVNAARPVVLSVALVSPTNGASFVSPANVELTAAVSSDTAIAAVDFIDGTNVCATVSAAPYSVTASNLSVGEHVLTALVTDSQGAMAISEPVTIIITNAPTPPPPPTSAPAVEMVTPRDGATFTAPARIILSARVAQSSRAVRRVEFFAGSTRLGTGVRFSEREYDHDDDDERSDDRRSGTAYVLVWNRVAAGSYSITAKVSYSGDQGASASSAPVRVTVRRGWSSSRYESDEHDD